ncbi:MAG: LEA type 2 family protein, partial [bacterium]|nr:LEA type 2 family protein [bacterium]
LVFKDYPEPRVKDTRVMNETMRRRWCIILLFLSLFLFSCGPFLAKPDVSFKRVKFLGGTLKEMRFEFVVDVSNPNPFSVTLKNFNYNLKVYDISLGEGEIGEEFQIEKRSTVTVSLPFKADFQILPEILKNIRKNDKIAYEVEGNGVISYFFGEYKFLFDKKGTEDTNKFMGNFFSSGSSNAR